MKSIPTITSYPVKGCVTLCGSHRFKDSFEYIAQELGENYWIVLRPAFYRDAHRYIDNKPKSALDTVHLANIDISEAIIVVNQIYPVSSFSQRFPHISDGYIGTSTAREIQHARENNRKVVWLCVTQAMLNNGVFLPTDWTYKEFHKRYNS